MKIDRIEGITLYVARRRSWWRPWWWAITSLQTGSVIEGHAWTRRQAIAHGRIARVLRIAGNEERDIIDRATREAQ